ncbi:MAG: cupin domain-containing protein [Phycisphaerales bacterium]|nr:cupin domain-containing protein [Phycisphaerales bacterium]
MRVASLADHPQRPVEMPGATGARMRMLVGPSDGASNFHMRHFEVAPGGFTPHHQHDYEHEILILRGSGTARSEAGDRPFRAGDVIWVPPNEVHQFLNTGAEPLEFICLIPAPRDCTAPANPPGCAGGT